ncbi:MAG: B12-binding domain-containing radical SAM protein [Candidatus Aenigmarchaeota archaeon]|nr:B12-binding domain-containing radical SAM protein [Candidatus Aenigmarchaeota archaeon]
MKLALVNVFEDEKHPPMGLVSIATYLKEYMGLKETKIIDATWENVSKGVFKEKFDVIGISSMTAYYDRAVRLAKLIKEKRKDVVVIMGGIHISTLPECLTKDMNIGVAGEGEETALELMKLYEKEGKFDPRKLRRIKGLVFWDKGKLVKTEKRELIKDLDTIPMKDLSFLDRRYFMKRWVSWNEKDGKETLLMTERGCPFSCKFCSTKLFWQRVRFHSLDYVMREIKDRIEKYGIDHFQITDDTFVIDKERLKKLDKLLEKEGLKGKIAFSCQPRANLMDDEMMKILKDLNIRSMNFGFESGSERMLNWLKGGNVTVEDNKKACLLGKKYGIKVYGSFIFGSPGETIEDMKETLGLIKFMYDNGAYKLWHFVMTPFPGTLIWQIAKERGKVSDDMDWTLLRHENYKVPLLLDDTIPLEEFQKVYFRAREICDKNWMGKSGWIEKTLRHDPKRLIRKAVQDPKRALNAVKVIAKKRFGKK